MNGTRWTAVVGLSLVAGTALALSRTAETRIAIERPAKAVPAAGGDHPHLLCNGGVEEAAELELVPDAVVSKAGRERIEYHAELTVRRGKNVGLSWEADVVDDRGRVVRSKLAKGSGKGKSGDLKLTNAIAADLDDGFYSVRVRAAVAADDEPSTVLEKVQYIAVKDGKWAELSDLEWRKLSRATLAFSDADVAGGAL